MLTWKVDVNTFNQFLLIFPDTFSDCVDEDEPNKKHLDPSPTTTKIINTCVNSPINVGYNFSIRMNFLNMNNSTTQRNEFELTDEAFKVSNNKNYNLKYKFPESARVVPGWMLLG